MKKILIISFLFSFLFLPPKVFAQDPNFDVSINSNYEIKNDGITELTQNVEIKNKTAYYYTPTYTVSIGFKNIQNIVAFGDDGPIPFTIDDNDKENKSIKLKFQKRYTGVGVKNNFTIKLETPDIATRRGNIWEISVPGISSPDDFIFYNTNIIVPDNFGAPQIIKPASEKITKGRITFSKDEVGQSGIYLLFGDSQYYAFELLYHISNPNLFPVKTEIALLPDTNYQNVLISSFSKKPIDVDIDDDGNWIAQYSLFPQQKMEIIVKGFVKVLPSPLKEKLTSEEVKLFLSPGKYWESDSNSIKDAAKDLKNPQEIYNFVVKKLSYNFDKVTHDNRRLGAESALKNFNNSVCLEFTDLFIALARASGIPARAVEGYAFTNNSTLRPLSLLEDVLHSWPEYYDFEKQKWIMVDPTWGNTTKGLDYLNSLDFEHIAFVIKGKDSTYPIPAGGYKFDKKSKDVFVGFANKQDFIKNEKLEITDNFSDFVFPGFSVDGSFTVRNTGNSKINNRKAVVVGIDGEKREYFIGELPPGGSTSLNVKFKKVPFLTNQSNSFKIQIGKFEHSKKITISYFPDLSLVLLFGGIILGSVTITIITYYTGSLLVQRKKTGDTLRRKSKRH